MIFCQNHLLLSIGAAHGGAITLAAGDYLPGAHTVNPGDLVRMLFIGGASYLAFVGPGSAQQPFVIQAGHHILILAVAIVFPQFGIERLEAGDQLGKLVLAR